MKITCKIKKESLELVNELRSKGLNAKLVRGGIIVELPKINSETYHLPEELKENDLLLDLSESGGGLTSRGSATVVCGLSGKKLKPYYQPRGGHLACETHAYFSVLNCAITISASKQSTNISIKKHEIEKNKDTAVIKTIELWRGEADTFEWLCMTCNKIVQNTDKHFNENGISCGGSFKKIKLSLPEIYDKYQAAAIAAREKACCYHCRSMHYGE